MNMFNILTVVMVSWVYTNVKTCILYTSNMCGLQCVYYISIKFLKTISIYKQTEAMGVAEVAEHSI